MCVSLLAVLVLLMPGNVVSASVTEELFRVNTDSISRAEIAGSLWRASGQPRGTLFMCHGFNRSMWDFRGYAWLAEDEHWNVVRFDFREHGDSTRSCRLSSLGYHEIWDLKAVIDWAEKQNLPKPYVCYGHSLGAAIALRWAGQDRRIAGVMAQSPFRNALDATRQFRSDDCRVRLARTLLIRGGRREMLRQVDIPAAISARDDLLLYVTVGQGDYFPESDVRAIVDASPSPARLKRFIVIPSTRHGQHWKWSGNDPLIRDFLQAAARSNRLRPSRQTVVGGGACALLAALFVARRMVSRATSA